MANNPLVYSTESGRIATDTKKDETPQGDGVVRIRRETKGRKGKGVTTISGLTVSDNELKDIARQLKKLCGTGGSVKDHVIEIQGDNRDRIKTWLEKKKFTVKLAGG